MAASASKTQRDGAIAVDWAVVGRLCERPGCSEPGAASYGMVPEDLLFWVDTFHPADGREAGLLCRRHADAMVVPRGWTLDDRREPRPRLFRSPVDASDASDAIARPRRRRSSGSPSVEQLELGATGLERSASRVPSDADTASTPWVPDFDIADDLDGLLAVRSPLLARAFRGTDRTR